MKKVLSFFMIFCLLISIGYARGMEQLQVREAKETSSQTGEEVFEKVPSERFKSKKKKAQKKRYKKRALGFSQEAALYVGGVIGFIVLCIALYDLAHMVCAQGEHCEI